MSSSLTILARLGLTRARVRELTSGPRRLLIRWERDRGWSRRIDQRAQIRECMRRLRARRVAA